MKLFTIGDIIRDNETKSINSTMLRDDSKHAREQKHASNASKQKKTELHSRHTDIHTHTRKEETTIHQVNTDLIKRKQTRTSSSWHRVPNREEAKQKSNDYETATTTRNKQTNKQEEENQTNDGRK